MVLHTVDQLFEGPGKHPDLVVPAVFQIKAVVAVVHLLRGLGELFKGLCDVSGIVHGEGAHAHENEGRNDQDLPDQRRPVPVRFGDRDRDGQAHAVAQRQPGRLLFHALKPIAEEGAAAERPFGDLGHRVLRQLRDVDDRVEKQLPVRVAQEGIAVFVEADALHLLGHGGVVDLDAHDADEASPVIDRDVVRDHTLVQIVRDIGREPDGLAGMLGHREPHQL